MYSRVRGGRCVESSALLRDFSDDRVASGAQRVKAV
jgi:hypothetical protein